MALFWLIKRLFIHTNANKKCGCTGNSIMCCSLCVIWYPEVRNGGCSLMLFIECFGLGTLVIRLFRKYYRCQIGVEGADLDCGRLRHVRIVSLQISTHTHTHSSLRSQFVSIVVQASVLMIYFRHTHTHTLVWTFSDVILVILVGCVTVETVWCIRAAPSAWGCATAARSPDLEWRCTGAAARGPCRRRRSRGPRSGWSGRSRIPMPGALRIRQTVREMPARGRRSCSVAA